MDKHFGGVIWTNHALQRLQERGIKQGDAWATMNRPDRGRYAATQGAWVYNRTFNGTAIEVVAKQNERKEWIVLSVWSRPVSRMHNRYLVRNRVVDWLLDGLVKLFSRKR